METRQMKQALRRLRAFEKDLSIDYFYTVALSRWGKVDLQGDFNSKVVTWALSHGFEVELNRSLGYVSLTKGFVTINLT